MMSVAPPGANPTMNRIGRLGYADGTCTAVRMNPADRAPSPNDGTADTAASAAGANAASAAGNAIAHQARHRTLNLVTSFPLIIVVINLGKPAAAARRTNAGCDIPSGN